MRRRLNDAELALLATVHGVDHEPIAQRARIVVDLRGATRGSGAQNVMLL